MSVIPDIITQLREVARTGSKVERHLAALILSDADFASRASIATFAQHARVSQPSITRLCRQLGCEGLRDFKLRLAQALALGKLYLAAPVAESVPHEERIVAHVCDSAVNAIRATGQAADMAVVMQIAERIATARQVYIYGSGGISSLGATELQNRLFRFSIPAIAHVDGQMQRMSAGVADAKTVVIAMSASGAAPAAVNATEIARRYGAATVALAPAGSALAHAAEVNLPFETEEDATITKPTPARYVLLVLIDLIAMATAERMGADGIESMRRVKLALGNLKDPARLSPIGD